MCYVLSMARFAMRVPHLSASQRKVLAILQAVGELVLPTHHPSWGAADALVAKGFAARARLGTVKVRATDGSEQVSAQERFSPTPRGRSFDLKVVP